jgi:hypothetical protein
LQFSRNLGEIINIIADLLLIVGPFPGYYGFETMAAHTPFELSMAGSILGAVVGIPIWLFLLVPLYYILKPAGQKFAVPVVITLGYTFVLSTVFHSAAALFHAAYSAPATVGVESQPAIVEIIARLDLYAARLPIFYATGITLGSAWLLVTILSGKTLYRRWMAVFSPLLAMIIPMLISPKLPAPIGGYFAPFDGSLMFTIFFLITTIATWNYQKEKPFDE